MLVSWLLLDDGVGVGGSVVVVVVLICVACLSVSAC